MNLRIFLSGNKLQRWLGPWSSQERSIRLCSIVVPISQVLIFLKNSQRKKKKVTLCVKFCSELVNYYRHYWRRTTANEVNMKKEKF